MSFRDSALRQMLTVAPFFVKHGIEWREDAIEAGRVEDPQVWSDLSLLYHLRALVSAATMVWLTCSAFFLRLAAQSGGQRRHSKGAVLGA